MLLYKYKDLILSLYVPDTPNDAPNTKVPWDKDINLLTVFRCDFGKYDLIYNGFNHIIEE